jgi:hypothetical protein
LPDGCKPKSQFGYILGLGMDDVRIFYGQLEHLRQFGTFYVKPFGIFYPFLVHCTKKNLATLVKVPADKAILKKELLLGKYVRKLSSA